MENNDFRAKDLDLSQLEPMVRETDKTPTQRAFEKEYPLIERVPGFAEYLTEKFETHALPGVNDYLVDVKVDSSGTAVFLYDHREYPDNKADNEVDIGQSFVGVYKDGQEFCEDYSQLYYYCDAVDGKKFAEVDHVEDKIETIRIVRIVQESVVVEITTKNGVKSQITLVKNVEPSELKQN